MESVTDPFRKERFGTSVGVEPLILEHGYEYLAVDCAGWSLGCRFIKARGN